MTTPSSASSASSAAPASSASSAAPGAAPRKDPWDLPDVSGLTVGVLGGTGDQGRGLAYRLARAGQTVDHRLAGR